YHPLDLHPFPTRRSSDLARHGYKFSFAANSQVCAQLMSTFAERAGLGEGREFDHLGRVRVPEFDEFRIRVTLWSGRCGTVLADRSEEHTSELQSRENLVC